MALIPGNSRNSINGSIFSFFYWKLPLTGQNITNVGFLSKFPQAMVIQLAYK
jgi:hypothetical protein